MTTATTVPDLQSLARLLSERHVQLAAQAIDGVIPDPHDRAQLLNVAGMLHQTAMAIYALREYRHSREIQG